jgi:hypothetical protein
MTQQTICGRLPPPPLWQHEPRLSKLTRTYFRANSVLMSFTALHTPTTELCCMVQQHIQRQTPDIYMASGIQSLRIKKCVPNYQWHSHIFTRIQRDRSRNAHGERKVPTQLTAGKSQWQQVLGVTLHGHVNKLLLVDCTGNPYRG